MYFLTVGDSLRLCYSPLSVVFMRLLLCSCDYEECLPLRYKNPVRTSQETHYVSATGPSQLMLGTI
jgi:hypothetical protein